MLAKRATTKSSKSSKKQNLKRTKTPSESSDDSVGPSLLSGAEFKLYRRDSLNLATDRLESVFLDSESDGLVPLFAVTETMHSLENSSGAGVKNKKLKLIVQLFDFAREFEPMSLAWIYMVFSCKVFPDYDNRDFGIGNSLVYQFISALSKKSETTLKKEMKKVGDLGTLASNYVSTSSSAPSENSLKLTFGYWFSKIRELTGISSVQNCLTSRGHQSDQTANHVSEDSHEDDEPERNQIYNPTDSEESPNRRLEVDGFGSVGAVPDGKLL